MNGAVSCRPVHQAALMLAGLCLGSRWECMGPTAGWGGSYWWGVSHIPSVLPWLFKAIAGVGHSLAMWPYP